MRSSLSNVFDGPPDDDSSAGDAPDGPHSAVEVAALPDVTGTPFLRAPSRRKVNTPQSLRKDERSPRPKIRAHDTYDWDDPAHLTEHSPSRESRRKAKGPTANVAVGVSRLHQVEMPELLMTPIYWTPVHDTAQVVRGTWYYHDTMTPVETDVAIMLEAGYIELQVWTETWKDELSSAIEIGAAGEEKIVHMLWPEKQAKNIDSRPSSRLGPTTRENLLQTVTANLVEADIDTPVQEREKAVEAASDVIDIATGPGGYDNKAAGVPSYGRQGPPRSYAFHGVIYANEKEARILKSSLLPSAYYGRRPLANYIRKNFKLGIKVVRGFDEERWEKLHPSKVTATSLKAEQGVATSASGAPPTRRRKTDPELALAERPKVSDLVLVVHGVGQKLSERMESFHFTYAMNSFRRECNVEAGTKEVKSRFRDDMGGIMVLPVNWRHSLSFEDGGYRDGEGPADNEFSLTDITPETLPGVRSLVSDVMLDVPYYMSHHQPQMIAAVIREANKVYQLWCQNNPGFAEEGRVHIIAHSLGSVMAVDILSNQPTMIPSHLSDPASLSPSTLEGLDHFLFRTSSLFLAGSPAGFFLLLKKAQLLPRLDYSSSTKDPAGNTDDVCGERGTYGCIAVENVYNIINGYDPVAYRMNATVDSRYAASLKHAWVPSSTTNWFGRPSSTSWFAGSGGVSSNNVAPARPDGAQRLPSTVELETHNFTREEVAEKRMLMLNDNGQIDFFVRYGGGALEIQYLTMLGAHSSYWTLKDFVRCVVQEVGRGKGRAGTIMPMRAVKRKSALG